MPKRSLLSEQREADLREQQRILKPIHDQMKVAWDRARFATYQARMADIAMEKAYREILARMDLISIELDEPEQDVEFDVSEEKARWELQNEMDLDQGDSMRKDALESKARSA